MSLDSFHVIQEIGVGSFSVVQKILRKEDNQIYALKRVNINCLNHKDQQNALNEIRILASIDHKNIVHYKEAFIDSCTNELCIVMDYLDQGDLSNKIKKTVKTSSYIEEHEIWNIFI